MKSRLDYAYFPTASIISVGRVAEGGAWTEVGTLGSEGVAWAGVDVGGAITANRLVVHYNGLVYRLARKFPRGEIRRDGVMRHLLLRHLRALLTQIAQMAVGIQRHTIDQQMCRWLLPSLDPPGADELSMAHEILVNE